MNEQQMAEFEVRRAAGNAGDASGSADASMYLFQNGDVVGAAERMMFARQQAEKAMASAAQAEFRLRRMISLMPAAI